MITPAQNFLKQHQIPHTLYEYECTVHDDFGHFTAAALNIEEARVFKTILLHEGRNYVTCITPSDAMISLKAAARAVKMKSLELCDPHDAERVTGFVVGGISPFGQKRPTRILLSATAMNFTEILVSGGRRGLSVGVSPQDLVRVLKAEVADFLEPRHN